MFLRYHQKFTGASIILLLTSFSLAVVIHDTIHYPHPVKSIRGKLTAHGAPVDRLQIDVYDNAQVCLDDALPPAEKRKRQKMVASAEPNEKGELNIKHLPKGFYEVEFGNNGNGGYDDLSVLINVDPKGTNEKICVDLALEGLSGKNTIQKCDAQ